MCGSPVPSAFLKEPGQLARHDTSSIPHLPHRRTILQPCRLDRRSQEVLHRVATDRGELAVSGPVSIALVEVPRLLRWAPVGGDGDGHAGVGSQVRYLVAGTLQAWFRRSRESRRWTAGGGLSTYVEFYRCHCLRQSSLDMRQSASSAAQAADRCKGSISAIQVKYGIWTI